MSLSWLREHTAPARTSSPSSSYASSSPLHIARSHILRSLAYSARFFLNNNNHHYGYIYRITRMPFSVLVSFFHSLYIISVDFFLFCYNYNLDYTLKTFLFTEKYSFHFRFFPHEFFVYFFHWVLLLLLLLFIERILTWEHTLNTERCSKRSLFNFQSQKKTTRRLMIMLQLFTRIIIYIISFRLCRWVFRRREVEKSSYVEMRKRKKTTAWCGTINRIECEKER